MASKKVLRYLKSRKDLELCYNNEADEVKLGESTDIDWAGLEDSRSNTSYSFQLQKAGEAIS